MDSRIKKIYILIKENRVLACDSNIRDFILKFPDVIKDIRQYDYYYKKFKESKYFTFEFNKDYIFQRIDFD